MLCHDRRYKAETAAGAAEVKDHVLDDATDELWAELRHAHIAGAGSLAVSSSRQPLSKASPATPWIPRVGWGLCPGIGLGRAHASCKG